MGDKKKKKNKKSNKKNGISHFQNLITIDVLHEAIRNDDRLSFMNDIIKTKYPSMDEKAINKKMREKKKELNNKQKLKKEQKSKKKEKKHRKRKKNKKSNKKN